MITHDTVWLVELFLMVGILFIAMCMAMLGLLAYWTHRDSRAMLDLMLEEHKRRETASPD